MINKMVSRYAAWRKVHSTINTLNGLSNKELDDIGINRGDIDRVARMDKR